MSFRASGLKAWLVQRVSAVYLGLFLIYFLGTLWLRPPQGYFAWYDWILSTPVALSLALAFIALLLHAWVGLRDVLIDYIHPFVVRLPLLCLLAGGLFACALWVGRILLTRM